MAPPLFRSKKLGAGVPYIRVVLFSSLEDEKKRKGLRPRGKKFSMLNDQLSIFNEKDWEPPLLGIGYWSAGVRHHFLIIS